jgi:hypothetical protein
MLIVGVAPGDAAEAATCRSDHITYVSDDGQREFIVTQTRRAITRVSHGGGTLTRELQVLHGQVGQKTFYVYDETTLSNTGRVASGARQQMRAVEQPSDLPLYKLKQHSWPVYFQEGSMAFHIFGSSVPEEMAGLWLYAACRDRESSKRSGPAR